MPRSKKDRFVYDCIAKKYKMRGTFEEKKKECIEEWVIKKSSR